MRNGAPTFAFLCKLCLFVFIVGLNKHASGDLSGTCTSDEIMNRFARADSVCVCLHRHVQFLPCYSGMYIET